MENFNDYQFNPNYNPNCPPNRGRSSVCKTIVILLLITNAITVFLAYRNGSIANANYEACVLAEQELNQANETLALHEEIINENISSGWEHLDADGKLEVIAVSYSIYEDNACFMSANGEKTYHNLSCKAVTDLDEYWLYDVRGAKAIGHLPCPYCDPAQ